MSEMKKQDILLGKRLQEIRESLGYTREEYAELLNISSDQYKRLERGESRITVDKVQMLYETYRVDPTYLIMGERPDRLDIDYFLANSKKTQRDEFIVRIMDYMRRMILR